MNPRSETIPSFVLNEGLQYFKSMLAAHKDRAEMAKIALQAIAFGFTIDMVEWTGHPLLRVFSSIEYAINVEKPTEPETKPVAMAKKVLDVLRSDSPKANALAIAVMCGTLESEWECVSEGWKAMAALVTAEPSESQLLAQATAVAVEDDFPF